MMNEQKLIDICFELVATVQADRRFENKPMPEVMAWVADQLRKYGFDTEPVGASWGILKTPRRALSQHIDKEIIGELHKRAAGMNSEENVATFMEDLNRSKNDG